MTNSNGYIHIYFAFRYPLNLSSLLYSYSLVTHDTSLLNVLLVTILGKDDQSVV